MNTEQAQEFKDFKNKYPTYMEVVKANMIEENKEEKEKNQNKIKKQDEIQTNQIQLLTQEFMIQMMAQMSQFI